MDKDNNNLINEENIIKKKKSVKKNKNKTGNTLNKTTRTSKIIKMVNVNNKKNKQGSHSKKNNPSKKKVNKKNEIQVLEEVPKKKISDKKSDTKIVKTKKQSVTKKKEIDNTKKEEVIEEIVPLKKKGRLKLRLWIKILLVVLIIFILAVLAFFGYKYCEKKEAEKLKKERDLIVEKVMKHYGEYVLIKQDTPLYRIDDTGNYYEYGMIYANTEVSLDEIEINYLTEYFFSKDLGCYLKYEDLEPISVLTTYDNRYKKYIVFNQNIITNGEFTLYDDNQKIYSFKESMSFPIIIKDYDGKYYVEFNNRLLYLIKDDIKEIINANNTKTKNASKVTTLCYHRVYGSNEKCNDLYICKKKSAFDQEMKYLKDNNYLTLTMEEIYLYLSKKLQVPKNSVVITLDDGYLFKSAIEVLEKYQINATGFIKTGSFSDFNIFSSTYLELQSHTDKMHVAGTCPRELSYQQGGGILCLSENHVLNDLKTSREKLNNAIALAYPFYDYNNRAINLVKKAGFKLAFIGASTTNGRSYPGINLYKVPRMTIWDSTSFATFKSYVKN